MDRRELLNNLEESSRMLLETFAATIWTAIPCIVTSVNLNDMAVEVQPCVQGVRYGEDGQKQFFDMPILPNVPLVFPSAGGFSLTLPVSVGDEVLVIFSARCIDSWYQSGGVQPAPDQRVLSLSDGFAIPGIKSIPKVLPNISTTGAQLRNDAGTSYIEISADGSIKMVSVAGVQVEGNLTVTGEITSGIIPLSSHTHGGVTTGSGITGVPLP